MILVSYFSATTWTPWYVGHRLLPMDTGIVFTTWPSTRDDHLLGVVVDLGDQAATHRERRRAVVLAVEPAADVPAVDVHRDLHGGVGLPEVHRPPAQLLVVDPTETARLLGLVVIVTAAAAAALSTIGSSKRIDTGCAIPTVMPSVGKIPAAV